MKIKDKQKKELLKQMQIGDKKYRTDLANYYLGLFQNDYKKALEKYKYDLVVYT